MSDSEIQRLEKEIADRAVKLAALRKPPTREEIRALAKDSPDEFNRRLDAGEINLAQMTEETS
jgi:hypothetical protein